MAVGGDITEIQFNNPDVGSGTIFPKAAEDNTFNLGGIKSTDDMNMIDGGGNMIDQMHRSRWSVETTVAWDMQEDLTLEKLASLAASTKQTTWTITHINGSVYTGTGKVVGDLAGNGNAATIALKISGGSDLKKQI